MGYEKESRLILTPRNCHLLDRECLDRVLGKFYENQTKYVHFLNAISNCHLNYYTKGIWWDILKGICLLFEGLSNYLRTMTVKNTNIPNNDISHNSF